MASCHDATPPRAPSIPSHALEELRNLEQAIDHQIAASIMGRIRTRNTTNFIPRPFRLEITCSAPFRISLLDSSVMAYMPRRWPSLQCVKLMP